MASALRIDSQLDSARAASVAGLRYVSDAGPGIRRVARGKGFVYFDASGRVIRNTNVLNRIRNLVIPPAWKDVWICPVENGHLQAIGRDARGRRQYRYHDRWQTLRNETKFHRMLAFGQALPRIRRRIRRDLRARGLPREKVLATVLTLLESTLIRVGNDEYASQNQSYGLTTMADRHVRIRGARIRFNFRGKSGKEHLVELADRRLARIVRECQDLPGQELFQFINETGKRIDVTSSDVNDYLREISGQDFTAKDFRTWSGTVLFIEKVRTMEPCESLKRASRELTAIVREVASQLRNTPTVCRKYYIHPFAVQAFSDQSIFDLIGRICGIDQRGRMPTEKVVMKLLQHEARTSRSRSGRPAPLVQTLRESVRRARRAR